MRRLLVIGPVTLLLATLTSCSLDDNDEIADTWMKGTMFGESFEAGVAAATIEADNSAVIRVFEAGTVEDACSADPTEGRRIEVLMGSFKTGRFDASSNDGWVVEAWDGTQGLRDPYSLIEIALAQREVGGAVKGQVRFGSAQTGDLVEGRFEAVVCAINP